MPYPLPLTRTEAYLAYKAGVIQQSDLKPSLAIPRNGIDAWLAYWTGLAEDYPKREDGTPHILQEEEAYIAYLCGVINEYPEKCLRRVGAYLRYLISARWGRPDHPLNREELYLSLIKTQFIPSGDPSSDIVIDGTAKAPFQDVKMYGDTFQQSYTGKNLAYLANASSTKNQVTCTINSNGSFTLNGTSSAGTDLYLTGGWNNRDTSYGELEAGTYTLSILDSNKQQLGSSIFDIQVYDRLGTNSSRIIAAFRGASYSPVTTTLSGSATITAIYISFDSGKTFDNETYYIQLEKSSSATSWEKYVGGVPSPNPDYPQPIQTVTGEQTVTVIGKNLFRAKDGQYKDSTLTVDVENGVIHVYGHQHATYDQNIWIPVEDIHADGTYTLTMNYSGSGSGAFRLAKDKSYQAANNFGGTYYAPNRGTPVTASATNITYNWILIYLGHDSSLSEVDYYINPQFESGSLSTYFSPYSKQTYTINLGKNLFDGTIYKTDYVLSSNGAETPYTSAVITSSIKVQPNTTYTVSANIQSIYDKYMRVGIYQGDMTFISRPSSPVQDGKLTFTTPANAQYVRLSYFVPATDVQLEVGSTASDFAPYFTPIELCRIEGKEQPLVFDYIYKDGDSWKVHKALGKQTIVGSDIQLNSSYSNVQFATVPKPSDSRMYGNYTAIFIYNDHAIYRYNSGGWNNSDLDHGVFTTPNQERYWFGYPKGTSLETMHSELNGAITYYALATPTDTVITNSNLIAQLDSLVNGGAEDGTTYIKVNATDPNLPGLLYVEAPKYE